MAAEQYLWGIKSVKYGTPTGSNTMPVTLTQLPFTVEGSFNLAEEDDTLKDFRVEESVVPVKQLTEKAGLINLEWKIYELTPAKVAILKEGTAGSETGFLTFAGPTTKALKELAIQIESDNGVIFNFYKVALSANMASPLTRGELMTLGIKGTVLDPGNGGSPYMYKLPNPA